MGAGQMIRLRRICSAGILAGLVMMAVAFGLHRPPLDELGWANFPTDAQVASRLSRELGHASGLYVYPALVGISAGDVETRNTHDRALQASPSGFVLYRAPGDAVDDSRAMPEELLKTLMVATLAAFLLAQTSNTPRYLSRFGFVAIIGVITSVSTHISYHAWFGFPGNYTVGRIVLDFVPWLFASLVIAHLVRPATDDLGQIPSK